MTDTRLSGEERLAWQPRATGAPGPAPWVLSARSPEALAARAGRLLDWAGCRPGTGPQAVARALARGRTGSEHRAVVLAEDAGGRRAALDALARGAEHPDVVRGEATGPARTAFLFSGQGTQRAGMGRELYAAFPAYATAFDEVCAELDRHLRQPLRPVLWAAAGTEHSALLKRTEFGQPALFALETALFALVTSWGVRPDRLLGHSLGGLVAAHVSGVLSLADACALVAARGRLMQGLPTGGAMAALRASEDEVLPLLRARSGRVGLAAVNGPRSVVVSGDGDAVAELVGHWRERGRRVKPLDVRQAFHSPHLDSMLADFLRITSSVRYAEPAIPVVSEVTGAPAGAGQLTDPRYWVAHARGTVRFQDGLAALRADGVTACLELGPDGELTGLAADCPEGRGALCVAALRRGRSETRSVRTALARLYCAGVEVDWTAVLGGRGPDLDLPG